MGKVDKSLMKRKKKVYSLDVAKGLMAIGNNKKLLDELATDITEKIRKKVDEKRLHWELQEAGLWHGPKLEETYYIVSDYKEVELRTGPAFTFRFRTFSYR